MWPVAELRFPYRLTENDPIWCHWRANTDEFPYVRTKFLTDFVWWYLIRFPLLIQSNKLLQFVDNHWCYELIYQTFSCICTQIITSNTDSKWAMFSLSERTAHRAKHYTLVDGIAKMLVPLWGTQLRKLSIISMNRTCSVAREPLVALRQYSLRNRFLWSWDISSNTLQKYSIVWWLR